MQNKYNIKIIMCNTQLINYMNRGEIIIYETPTGNIKIDVHLADETVWLTQKAMAALFGVHVPAINKHLKNIFEEGELDATVVISKMETTTEHGAIAQKTQTRKTNFYNLDAIISVGYRVNSAKATAFRIWATKTLKEFIIKLTADFSLHFAMSKFLELLFFGINPKK